LFPLLLVIVFLERLTESRQQQIRRLNRQGHSQRVIAQRLGISRHRVRQALA
jgi:DNA-binding NarL/FixJ family response regulator